MAKHDGIIVLGGGITQKGIPTKWVESRLDKAAEVFKDSKQGADYIITTSFGTVFKSPILDKDNYPLTEARAAANYLLDRGVPPEKIFCDEWGLDTLGNIYFARTIHTDIANSKNLLIITSEFHMRRTKSICDVIFNLSPKRDYNLDYVATPNIGLKSEEVEARVKKENERTEQWEEISKDFCDLKELRLFLFTQHGAYSVNGRRAQRIGNKTTLKSY